MPNINTELTTISNGKYGSDVRGAMHDALEKLNYEDSGNINVSLANNITFETGGFLVLRKIGKIVFINGNMITSSIGADSQTNSVTIANIDAAYRPSMIFGTKPFYPSTETVKGDYRVQINSSGNLYVVMPASGSIPFRVCFSLVYFVD